MKKKIIGIIAAIAVVLGLGLIICNQIIPNEYEPADDEIALHIQLDVGEDIGLLVYDYRVNGHEYSGGISNADRSLIKHDSDNIVVWNKEELSNLSDACELSVQFRIITEYVAPNYENVYPDDITKYMEPISWEARFGESYFITITGDKINGYKAVWPSSASWQTSISPVDFRKAKSFPPLLPSYRQPEKQLQGSLPLKTREDNLCVSAFWIL